jgi:hypothetical protein
MQAAVEIQTGSQSGKRIDLAPGQTVQVGRAKPAGVVIADDPLMSNVHFALSWDGTTCRLRDLNSRFGTTLNGRKVAEANLANGDVIVAGQIRFRVRIEEPAPVVAPATAPTAPATAPATPPSPAPRAEPVQVLSQSSPPQDLLQALEAQQEPLFAILDAARDPVVLARLLNSGEQYQSLYEGAEGETLAFVAPYLVYLPKRSPFLATLVREGWGKNWGVYLTCGQTFKEVRRHLRHFLLVKTDTGKELYFRFYDPRVLRTYLPTCTVQEITNFFGPIRSYLLEAEKPACLLQYYPGPSGLQISVVPLTLPEPVPAR